MANTKIIQPHKFCSRRWELTVYWAREIQRNPRRSRDYEDPEDDGMTDEQRQEMYEYFRARDMVMPTTRAGRNKMYWGFKRVDRLTKRVHTEKFWREMEAD